MNTPKRSFMSLRTAGRAFWIGLAVSLALHAFLLVKARFETPKWEDLAPLEARLETEAPKPVAKPTASPPQALPKPAPKITAPPAPAPARILTTPASTESASLLPLPADDPPADIDKPHSTLTQAAESIRQLPARMEIVYELRGMLSGRQTHVWDIDGERYTLVAEGQVTGLASVFMRGKLIQKSSGRIGALGLMPEQYEMQHLNGKKEILRFDYPANRIESTRIDSRRGTRSLELPLITSAQDPLSSIYQLAMAARDGKDGLIVAASSKRVKGYPYRMLGTETLRTAFGEIDTLHVVRAGDAEKGGTHLWLSPAHHALPVKVAYQDENGTEWILEAVNIKTN